MAIASSSVGSTGLGAATKTRQYSNRFTHNPGDGSTLVLDSAALIALNAGEASNTANPSEFVHSLNVVVVAAATAATFAQGAVSMPRSAGATVVRKGHDPDDNTLHALDPDFTLTIEDGSIVDVDWTEGRAG